MVLNPAHAPDIVPWLGGAATTGVRSRGEGARRCTIGPMRRRVALTVLAILLTLALAPLGAGGQAPPGPTIRHQFRTDGLPAAGPMELLKWVLDYAPGAATPPHTHAGLLLGTQLEGEVTFSHGGHGGTERVYRTGETLIEMPGEVGLARNAGPGRLLAMISMVAPAGSPPSTPQPGGPAPAPPPPTTLYLYRTAALIPAEPYEVAHAVLDFAPGAQTPLHTHPGQVVVTVLEGELTFTTGGAEKTYQVGESFVELPEVVGQARNAGTTRTTVLATYLLPKGAPLSTPVTTPGLPATGAGGTVQRSALPLVALLLGTLLLAGGWGVRRRLGGA